MIIVKNDIMRKCRVTLAENGFTFSSNVSANVALTGYGIVKIDLNR
jgi:hypothetical protein